MLKKIQNQKEIVQEKEKQIINNSESIQNTFRHCIEFDDD